MQRVVDSALGVAKESIRTFSQESFNNVVKLVNGFSALVLAVLPGKTNALEAVTGWEQYPTFRPPRLPKWMEEGVSSFNRYMPDFDLDGSDTEEESEVVTDTEEEDASGPPSPAASQSSRMSSRYSSTFSRTGSVRRHSLLRWALRRLLWPLRVVLRWLGGGGSAATAAPPAPRTLRRSNGSSGSLKSMLSVASKRITDLKDGLSTHRTTDSRRRGIIEDMQLGVELGIEKVFDVVRRWILYFLSPWETFKAVLRKLFVQEPTPKGDTVVVQTATLGESDSSLKTDRRYAEQPLNTDARTCGDFITAMGYPYESYRVTTSDGYILSLERIPRPASRKVLYLQHGILDSSLGWVSSGVVGSQAFAAFDQGFDVFLGNFRGLASRDHVNKNISSRSYWRYSVNEHGTQDVPALLEKVNQLKLEELSRAHLNVSPKLDSPGSCSEPGGPWDERPYSLCGVSHSLGGAAMLIYLVTRRLEGRPHYMDRAILLSPSGFHEHAPPACILVEYLFPLLAPILKPVFPGLYIPTKFFRMVFNKLSRDFQNYPALGGVVQTLMSFALGGDSSNWVGAFGMTHYNMDDMPGIAFDVALHLVQMKSTKKFMLFDLGSAAANRQAYGTDRPLDVGANYGVIDIPVDVLAGKKDKLVPKSMVAKHYQTLKEAGVRASYSEFEYAHLDFTFSNRDEVLEYVMSRLMLVRPGPAGGKRRRRKMDRSSSKSKGQLQSFGGADELRRDSGSGDAGLETMLSGEGHEKRNSNFPGSDASFSDEKAVENQQDATSSGRKSPVPGTGELSGDAGMAKMSSAQEMGNSFPQSTASSGGVSRRWQFRSLFSSKSDSGSEAPLQVSRGDKKKA